MVLFSLHVYATGSLDNLYDFCVKSHELLSNNLQLLDDVLATLSLQEHSMGILSVLIVKMKSVTSAEEHDLILPRVKEFIEGSSVDHIRVASDLFATLCHLYTNLMIEDGRAIKGINTIITGIEKVQVHVNQLTSIHSDVCLLSLTSKCLKPVLQRILCHDINDISKENGHFDVKYFLLYYYYGGMIYAAVKDFDRALIFFEAALTTQSMAVSHIMIESYKKYVLISLIVYGKIMPLPKYTPQVVSRFIRGFCDPYINIAQSYSSNNPEEVKAVITKHQTVFQSDKNEGLVKQVLNSLHKKNIQRLTKTFLTLSLTDVSSRVFLENEREAEDRVVRMVSFFFTYNLSFNYY